MDSNNGKLRQRNKTPNSSEQSLNGEDEALTGTTRAKARPNSPLISSLATLSKVLTVLVLLLFIIVFIVSPLIFRYSPTVRRLIVFMNYVNFPLNKNLSDPHGSFGLNCTRNLYLHWFDKTDNATIRLGIWHKLPASRDLDCAQHKQVEPAIAFKDNRPIFFYLHGNGGARGGNHRRALYEVLTRAPKLDGHVITLDYRGYGDSSNVRPSADGLKRDATAVYNWLLSQKHVNRSRVISYGHSLGTAVNSMLLSDLVDDANPRAAVLEAPFTSIGEAVYGHPYAMLYSKLFPYFKTFFVEPLVETNETNFDSISRLSRIRVPLLILHAEDDRIVPFNLGVKLYEQALKDQPKNVRKAQMVAFNGDLGYGHKYILRDAGLPHIIDQFINAS